MRLRVVTLFLLLGLGLGSSSLFAREVTLACVDCYSSASFYPQVAQELVPGVKVKWIFIQTHDYDASYEAHRKAFPAGTIFKRLDGGTVEFLRQQNVHAVLGGMDKGTYEAIALTNALGMTQIPDEFREMIRRKDLQAIAARQWGIPTHKMTNVDDALEFAASLYQGGVVLKYNAGAAGYEMEFISKSDMGHLRNRLAERLASVKPGPFGEVDDLILQPHIIGREYFLNSLLVDSHFYPTALSRYYRIHWGEKGLYFINTFLSLTTTEAIQLRQIAEFINDSQGHHNGLSHLEFIIEESTGRIYLLENNARVAGAGVPMLERAVYGISQLDLNILRVLDPVRLKVELAKLPRERQTNGLMFVIPSPMDGEIKQQGVDFLTSLPTYFEMPKHYRPIPGPVKKTKDLYSATVFHQWGEGAQLQTDVGRIISTLDEGRLFNYSAGSVACKDNLFRAGVLMEALRAGVPQVDWAALK